MRSRPPGDALGDGPHPAQLNVALHRIAITQSRHDPESRAYLQKRMDSGDTKREAIRALRRRLSHVVYRTLLHDSDLAHPHDQALAEH